jgi:LCP family protein required for cell wall assembly
MQRPQGPRPRTRSAFTAAFLSLIFPGLGHAYDGAWSRALGFAAVPLLLISLLAGVAASLRLELLGFLLQPWVLSLVLVLDALFLLYRIVAAIDAYRVATYLNAYEASGGGRLGRPRLQVGILSLAGLLAVLLVIAGGHVAVAYYDLQAYDLVNCVFDESGQATCDQAAADASPSVSPDASGSVPSASVGGTAAPGVTAAPGATLPPWNGKDRLNILLVGADQRPREGTFNTDTMIVVSIDPVTRQVAMLQLPRDTVDVPLPPGPARSVFGTTYSGKINSLWTAARQRPDLFPGNDNQRGPNALKATLGYLYGLDIRYYIAVNFQGFKQIVDTLGGVTVNVQNPVMDDHYPGDDGRLIRVYIPSGVQHMDGSQALIYARSRHASNDFDRGQRQQRVLLSLREQTDFSTVISKLPSLISALKSAVKTDIPPGMLPQLVQLASSVDTSNIRSYVFAPPLYQREVLSGDPRGYVIIPYVDKIRAAVATAFTADPKLEADREKLAAEGASVWVVNGSGQQGQASQIATYLEFLGINASAPNQRPDTQGLSTTRIQVYNGAETKLPETLRVLQQVFGVQPVAVTDPAVAADIVVTTSPQTPDLTPPPQP